MAPSGRGDCWVVEVIAQDSIVISFLLWVTLQQFVLDPPSPLLSLSPPLFPFALPPFSLSLLFSQTTPIFSIIFHPHPVFKGRSPWKSYEARCLRAGDRWRLRDKQDTQKKKRKKHKKKLKKHTHKKGEFESMEWTRRCENQTKGGFK